MLGRDSYVTKVMVMGKIIALPGIERETETQRDAPEIEILKNLETILKLLKYNIHFIEEDIDELWKLSDKERKTQIK